MSKLKNTQIFIKELKTEEKWRRIKLLKSLSNRKSAAIKKQVKTNHRQST